MAKRKKPTPDDPQESRAVDLALSSARENFRKEIEQLLDKVPAEQWDDPEVRGVLYDFVPWHEMSTITIQTRDDDPRDIGGWKYYFSADSDGSLIQDQYDAYNKSSSNGRLVYHKLLIEAAEAFLTIKFGKYCNSELPTPLLNLRDWNTVKDDFCLNGNFLLQVYDPDGSYQFNYCEYVMARRLESTQADDA